MDTFELLRNRLEGQSLTFLGSTPYVYHCHHFNLFHDQTVEDALGEELAAQVKTRAARQAVWELLSDAVRATGASTPAERLELAASMLPAMGHGRLSLGVEESGGSARGEYLHYSYTWREKYGGRVSRDEPIDAFAAGYAAAATEVAFNLTPGSVRSVENQCYVQKRPYCEFALDRVDAGPVDDPANKESFAKGIAEPATGLDEERIATIGAGLADFVATVGGDERGLVQAFAVYVTLHLSSYYDQTAYETLHHVEKNMAASLPAAEALFGESGHVCVFNTFGNILLSPEWEGMVGPLSGDVEDTVAYCCAIARGLGFGHWYIHELTPGERLVLRASSNYEAPFYLARYGRSSRPRSYVFANAARAIMQLAHRVDWKARPQLTEELYQSLFREGLSWNLEQTNCLTMGDEYCEAVVTLA